VVRLTETGVRPTFTKRWLKDTRPSRGLAILLLTVLALIPHSRPAFAQAETREGIYLQNQILQLRQELDQLRRNPGTTAPVPARGGAPSELVSALLDRVGRLEEETRSLRGKLDETEYRNRQLSATVEKLQGDLDFRMQQIEGGRNAAPPIPPPAATPSAPPVAAAPPPRTPERVLAEGQAALSRRDYVAAEAAAREVLAVRGSPRAYDARFLLAEAEAAQRNWQDAAIAYGDAYKASPRGSRAPEALIGFGNSLANFGQKKDACEAFALALSENPGLRGPIRERLDAGRQRAGCR
jgi:TolA-binding protein